MIELLKSIDSLGNDLKAGLMLVAIIALVLFAGLAGSVLDTINNWIETKGKK